MDAIDKKILALLDKNPRISSTQLAKKALISQQVANYRIKRLLEQKVISKFGTIINLKALHREHYRIFFTFNAKKEYPLNSVFSFLKEETGVYWSARLGGKYDLLVALFVKDFEEFDKFIDKFNSQFPGLIKDYKSCYAIEHQFCRHKHLTSDNELIKYGYNDKLEDIDDLDYFILNKLKDNCRLSALEIADERKISYKTVINRIKSLEKRKIILGYRLFLKSVDQKPFILLISFKNYAKREESSLLSALASEKEVTQIVRLFGLWNLFVNIRAENSEKVQELLIRLRSKFDLVDNYEIIPIFEDISINLMPF